MKKKILTLFLTAVLTLSLLPTAARAAESPWTGTDGGASGLKVETAPSVAKWALTIDPKADGLAKDTDVYAVVIPTNIFEGKGDSFLTSINATNYADAKKLGLNANEHRAAAVKYAKDAPTTDIPAIEMKLPAFSVQAATYHRQYTYILFSNRGTGEAKHYYTGTFWVDTEGNTDTRDASYMARYNGNANSVGSDQIVVGTPGNVITKPEASATPLTFTGVSRQGYTFLGWDKNKDLMGTSPNDAAASTTQPTYTAGSKPDFAPTDTGLAANQIQDLFAIWKPVQVTIAHQTAAMGELRVGVSFTYTPVLGGGDGTKKTVSVSAEDDEWLSEHGLSVSENTITGVPTTWTTEGKTIALTVTDAANKTTATLVVDFPQIEKGRQPQPDMSVNTGLASQMVDDGDDSTQDGQLIGFYSAGQKAEKDSANTSMTDGTGTYTNYYLSKGMIYEYRPKTEAGDGPWRAIPAPEGYYGLSDEAAKTAFKAALAAGSTGDVATTKVVRGGSVYTIQPVTAWDAAYGAIQFVDGLPVVAGLAKDAEYEIRFRENDTYDPSSPTSITIGGVAASAGGGGPSISFHLAGGELPRKDDGSGETVDFTFLYEGLTAGQTVEIPPVEPLREGYSFEGWTDGATLYRYDKDANPAVSVTATDGPLTLAAKWMATTEGFCSVVFYDWDGTLLGSRIVPKGGSLLGDHATPDQRGDGADQAPMPPEYELLWDVNNNGEYDFIGNNNVGNDAANKMGYTFAGWVDNETGYSVPNVAAGAARGQKIPAEDLVSLTNITTNLVLKAAYDEDASLIGANVAARRYLISYTPFVAASGALQTTITVRRPQNARRTVEGETILQIALQPNQRGQTRVDIPLGNTDVETVTFRMPMAAADNYQKTGALTITVFDATGVSRSADTSINAADIVAH